MFRTAFATVLVLLGCLLAGPAVAAYVLVDEVTDQATYLDTVTPLADEPGVRSTVAARLSAAVGAKVPEQARQLVDTGVTSFVESPEFKTAWVELNKEAHPQVIALLRDEPGTLAVDGDAIVLDLAVLSEKVKARMIAQGVPLADQLPAIDAKVQVISGPAVRDAVPAFALLEKLSVGLPIAAIILIALGLAMSARRGVTLVVTGFGLVVVMVLVIIIQALARTQVTARSPEPELTGPFYDALTSKVSVVLWVICAIGGVFVIVGGILARRASAARDSAARARPAASEYSERRPFRR